VLPLAALGLIAGIVAIGEARGFPVTQGAPRPPRLRLYQAPPTPPGPSGPYLGQEPPGLVPVVFAPDIVSMTESQEGGITFSPDGNEIYFGRTGIWFTKQVDGVWTTPAPAPIPGGADGFEPSITPSGGRMYFASMRDGDSNGPQIWYAERSGDGWSAPRKLGPASPSGAKMAPSAASNGNLYFTSVQGNMGWFYMARWANGSFSAATRLPSTINRFARHDHAFITPDEATLVFAAVSSGGQYLFASFKDRSGYWTTPVSLGSNVNATINQIQPSISPDGKYLFFTRDTTGDIWWVDANVVYALRPSS